MKLIVLWGLIALAFMGAHNAAQVDAAPRNVILIRGYDPWPGYNDSVYNQMATDLTNAGYKVWIPKLPRSGGSTGDAVKNAEALKAFVQANNITSDTVLVGHSFGGLVIEYYTRYLNTGEVIGRVFLDSGAMYGPGSGYDCWFVPDQCSQSFYNTLKAANPRTDIPVMNIANNLYDYLGVVDCGIKFRSNHSSYPKQQFVRDKVKGFVTLGMC